jgi:UDP-N-acetylglucosamine 2-epimerase (non-hydrolysing)
MRVLHVVGARPNFMKLAPVWRQLAALGTDQILVHTGQHFDLQMSDVFFDELALPAPDHVLAVGAGSHAEQTARVLLGLEPLLFQLRPACVLVYGDVNSTVAAALAAAKLQIGVVHVEAGLRSGDRTMPEELNRIVTDQLADLLLTPSADADENLAREGIPSGRVVRVGNVMIDTLMAALPRARALDMPSRLGLEPGRYALCTLHRPSNVDRPADLAALLDALEVIQREYLAVVWPLHPRTRQRLAASGLASRIDHMARLHVVDPLGYLECLGLSSRARLVLTDSGGLQEETTALGVPCLTLRDTTERPVTVELGTNTVTGSAPERVLAGVEDVLSGRYKRGSIPPLWDGQAGMRSAAALWARFGERVALPEMHGRLALSAAAGGAELG